MRPTDVVPTDREETFRTLVDLGYRKFGPIPPVVLAEVVMAATERDPWTVSRAALEALVRRYGFAEREELKVIHRPAKGAMLGAYRTAAAGPEKKGRRPYDTWLSSLSPARGNCDCPDYVKSSLGLCKHLLVVLTDVYRRDKAPAPARHLPPELSWDPLLPMDRSVDRLSGLRRSTGKSGRLPRGWERSSDASVLVPDEGTRTDPTRRAAFLQALSDSVENASPAARAVVRDELERSEWRLGFLADAPRALSALSKLRRELYPYQREGVRRFFETGRLLLADDMGLGKTTQAIAACHGLFQAGIVEHGILIVPSALKPQWEREWRETSAVPVTIVEGSPAQRAAHYTKKAPGFSILGYEQLLRDFQHIQRIDPDMVILDEAQRIKNFATKSAVYVKALAPRWRLVLTGTPMENRLEELASLLDWVDELALAPAWRLSPAFLTGHGARNLDRLRARLSPCVVRRRRQEVLRELPARTDTRVPIEITPQQREEHDQLSQPIAALVAQARIRPLRPPQFLRLMQMLTTQRIIANGLGQLRFEELWPTYSGAQPDSALLEGLFAPKLLELRRLVTEVAVRQERKVVVFSQWRRMLTLSAWSLRDVLGEAGLRAVFFTGAESQRERTRSIVDFHDDPSARVMFLTDAGGVGLNLQRAASACVNLELPWNPAVLEQRIGRIYRLGQKRPIDVFNLVTENSIEARIASLVAGKHAIFTGLFDGTSDEVRFAEKRSFLSDVEKLVEVTPASAPPPVAVPADDGEGAADVAGLAQSDSVPVEPSPDERATTGAGLSFPSPELLPVLFQNVRVTRTATGDLHLTASGDSAAALASVFDALASMMRGATATSSTGA
jgi:hypothetical protein